MHGIASIMPAGASDTPPKPGLIKNDQGVWGSYEASYGGSGEFVFVPYVATTPPQTSCPPGYSWLPDPTGKNEFACVPNAMPPMKTVTTTGDSTPGTTGTGDGTPWRGTGLGDQVNLVPMPIGDRSFGPPALPPGYHYVTGVHQRPSACSPGWGSLQGSMPSYGNLQPAALAVFGTELNLPTVVNYALFGLATVAGYKYVKRMYARS